MKYHDRLVFNIAEINKDHFEKVKMIVRLLALEKKCTFKNIIYEEDKERFHTHKWVDKEKELEINYQKNLTIPAIFIDIEANNKELWERFVDLMDEKLNVYAIESLLRLTQELVNQNHYLLRIVGLGTYFIKPYPFNINFLISENLFSNNEENQKSAIIAAGLAGKETFKYDLEELLKDQLKEDTVRLINESLSLIEYTRKNRSKFYSLD